MSDLNNSYRNSLETMHSGSGSASNEPILVSAETIGVSGAGQAVILKHFSDGTTREETKQVSYLGNNFQKTEYEEIALSGGNETISISNPEKIVGFTLVSSQKSLSTATGKMMGCWEFGAERQLIRCFMQTFEPPYVKLVACSCFVDDAESQFVISEKTARYIDVRQAMPQGSFSNHGESYQLGGLILKRHV